MYEGGWERNQFLARIYSPDVELISVSGARNFQFFPPPPLRVFCPILVGQISLRGGWSQGRAKQLFSFKVDYAKDIIHFATFFSSRMDWKQKFFDKNSTCLQLKVKVFIYFTSYMCLKYLSLYLLNLDQTSSLGTNV